MPDWTITLLISVASWAIPILLALLAKLPEKLLDQKLKGRESALKAEFDTKLENEKHRLNKEIERLKSDLSHISDRGVRSNEREYAAVIAAWECFVDAFVRVKAGIVSFSQSPNFENLDDEWAQATLDATELTALQKKSVMHAKGKDREEAYHRSIKTMLHNKGHRAFYNAITVIRKQGIFIPKELEDKFVEATDLLNKAQAQDFIEMRGQRLSDADATGKLFQEGNKIFEDLKVAVRDHLLAPRFKFS